MCNCVTEFDELAKAKNLQVDSTIPMRQVTLPDGNRTIAFLAPRPIVRTLYIEKPKRGSGQPPPIEIKFCPFCGQKYPNPDHPTDQTGG